MSNVLVVFAHPSLQTSRVQRSLIRRAPSIDGVSVRDLYELYPEFDVDVEAEQAALLEHDVIVWQHPLYWYSTPPLLKQWIDLVLEHGWAYGSKGAALHGKTVLSVISAGGPAEAYCSEGYNRYSIRQLLAPLEQTARLCGMRYLPPSVVFGTHRLTDEGLAVEGGRYEALLRWLVADGWKEIPADQAGLLQESTACTPWPRGGAA
jgi:glutathione-regulated potassium-efflux system ancillary protein KefG